MEWKNWSGSLTFEPAEMIKAKMEDDLVSLVHRCIPEQRHIRVVGAGHSSSPLVRTTDVLLSLADFKGILNHDKANSTITCKTGMTVDEANSKLQEMNLALFNTGDVDVQTLAGAISTGTHGTGRALQNLSSMLVGVRLVDGRGNLRTITEQHHPTMMNALRVSLGTLGIFTEITVKVVEAFSLERLELFTTIDQCVRHFLELSEKYRNVDFYWYPRSDETKIRILDKPNTIDHQFPFKFKCVQQEAGPVAEILPRERVLKFDEMEYSFEMDIGLTCFEKIRQRIKQRHRKEIAWRVLVRIIKGDENFLSPHYGRDSMTISLHHNAGLPYEEYFNDLEPIFIEYGGRPHWGKKHTLMGKRLHELYPRWNDFMQCREEMDPDGLFLNNYLNKIFFE